MERAKGFEPSTSTLARWSSTTELSSLKNGVKFIINAYNNASKKCNFFLIFFVDTNKLLKINDLFYWHFSCIVEIILLFPCLILKFV